MMSSTIFSLKHFFLLKFTLSENDEKSLDLASEASYFHYCNCYVMAGAHFFAYIL